MKIFKKWRPSKRKYGIVDSLEEDYMSQHYGAKAICINGCWVYRKNDVKKMVKELDKQQEKTIVEIQNQIQQKQLEIKLLNESIHDILKSFFEKGDSDDNK